MNEDSYNIVGGNITALHLASAGAPEFVEKLLTIADIIVDPVSEDGKTPFFVAVNYAQTKILRMLHAAGADIFAPDGNGLQPINIAANFGKLETVKTLIELGADVDQIGGWEYMVSETETPLIAAASYGYVDIVEYLVKKGADLDIKSSKNKTALDYAVEQGHQDVAKILREAATG